MKTPIAKILSPSLRHGIRRDILAWFHVHKRPMPWRNTTDPYRIWLSEVMLQQTQVATVESYYHRFLQRFPDVLSLAAAELEEVLKLWAGLGYYRRAKSLHQAAHIIASEYDGVFPSTYNHVIQLPGIGRYTAGAICSIAFNQPVAVLDGNVMRVLTRLLAIHDDISRPQTRKRLWEMAQVLVPRGHSGDFNQAMMELGATVCTPVNPRCDRCPLRKLCAARRANLQDQLPVKKAKPRAPRIRLAAVIVDSPRGRLMARRKAGGLWEHLWEFPAFELSDPTAQAVAEKFFTLCGLRVQLKRQSGMVAHQLTHRRMEYEMFFGHCKSRRPAKLNAAAHGYDAIRWISDLKTVPVARITGKLAMALSQPTARST